MRVAAMDLGTNTFLCLIAEVNTRGQIVNVLADETELVRLGQDLNATGIICQEALARAEHALARYARLAKEFRVSKVAAVATSAARDARNKDDFFTLTQKYEIPVKIISGGQEAQITFAGAISGPTQMGDTVIDVGGGSTEIVIQQPSGLAAHSFQIGSVRLAETLDLFPPFSIDKIQLALDHCRAIFSAHQLPILGVQRTFAVAGTPTTLAAMEQGVDYSVEKVDGYILNVNQFISWAQKLAHISSTEISRKYAIEPKRADVLPAGAIVLASAIKYLQQHDCIVSTRGVRYGLALSMAQEL